MDISITINNISRQTRDDLVAALTTEMNTARDECRRYAYLSDNATSEGERLTYLAECNRYDAVTMRLCQMIHDICAVSEVQA